MFCSYKFRKIHKKLPVSDPHFNKVTGAAFNWWKKRLQNNCFPVSFTKFLRKSFLKNTSSSCFWNLDIYVPAQTKLYLVSANRVFLNMPQTKHPLSVNSTKCSSTLKQFVSNLPTNCLSLFHHFVGLVLKGLKLAYLNIRFYGNFCS